MVHITLCSARFLAVDSPGTDLGDNKGDNLAVKKKKNWYKTEVLDYKTIC